VARACADRRWRGHRPRLVGAAATTEFFPDDLTASDSLLTEEVFSLRLAITVAEVELDVDKGVVESYFPISCLIDLSSVDGFSLSRVTSLDDDFMSE
jgi:hypothetical protein